VASGSAEIRTPADPRTRGYGSLVNVTFYGVRGSTPCPCDGNQRYGGNTSCVGIEVPGHEPIGLDLGTGLRFWGEQLPWDGSFRGHALVTHLHWDHVQGLPFFVPINRPGASLDIYAPFHDDLSVAEHFDQFMKPPYFPVTLDALAGDIRFHGLGDEDVAIGDAKVRARFIPHVGSTLGYRVEIAGVSIAYLPDHQQPLDGTMSIAEGVLELCDGADLLIHDAQYTPEEFELKAHWGHCTVDYALHVGREAGVKRLALFHHDPDHQDHIIDRLLDEARETEAGRMIGEVVAAHEGLTISFD
jgi:phosphoribosyl 1,2-cyclic phosphodiesterase